MVYYVMTLYSWMWTSDAISNAICNNGHERHEQNIIKIWKIEFNWFKLSLSTSCSILEWNNVIICHWNMINGKLVSFPHVYMVFDVTMGTDIGSFTGRSNWLEWQRNLFGRQKWCFYKFQPKTCFTWTNFDKTKILMKAN